MKCVLSRQNVRLFSKKDDEASGEDEAKHRASLDALLSDIKVQDADEIDAKIESKIAQLEALKDDAALEQDNENEKKIEEEREEEEQVEEEQDDLLETSELAREYNDFALMKGYTPEESDAPSEWPIVLSVPVTGRPLIPGYFKTITLTEPSVIAAIHQAIHRKEPYLGVFLSRSDTNQDTIASLDDIYNVGTFAKVQSSIVHTDGAQTFLVNPIRRITATQLLSGGAARLKTMNVVLPPYDERDPLIAALRNELCEALLEAVRHDKLFRSHLVALKPDVLRNAALLVDLVAVLSSGRPHELQAILDGKTVIDRLKAALVVLKKQLAAMHLQEQITKDVEDKFSETARRSYLFEQLRTIRKVLGLDADAKEKFIETLQGRAKHLPSHVRTVYDEELARFSSMEGNSLEAGYIRTYLDWLVSLPWNTTTTDVLDVDKARAVLDADHYGLSDVKDRIVEFIAVAKLRGQLAHGKILCLAGPPGVGKTSIGKSIARALDRKYYRFSVGGLADVNTIKGFRRTYVGALPGKIPQALKQTGTMNPLILIDEIDKISAIGATKGDPSAAMLELLDPEQNSSFMDDYLDVPIDLSKVLFVCTANYTDRIPPPLLDRMEIIDIAGYTDTEIFQIAKQYLIPQATEACGIPEGKVNLTDDAIKSLIRDYCREPGVRKLKQFIDKCFRKAALSIVRHDQKEAAAKEAAKIEEAPSEESQENKDNAQPPKDDKPKKAKKKIESKPEVAQDVTEVSESSSKSEVSPVSDCPPLTIDAKSLRGFVGGKLYTSERLYEVTPPGVTPGLCFVSSGGGESLYIESIRVAVNSGDQKQSPAFILTGNFGNIMKESSTIAFSFAKSFYSTLANVENPNFFNESTIHLHAPQGAILKDGPSAGITMVTSLLSLALNTPVKQNLAMTGELSLSGKVLAIGGLKEKSMAAKREGMKDIIFPSANLPQWEDIDEHVREGLVPHPVDNYAEVFKICFPSIKIN